MAIVFLDYSASMIQMRQRADLYMRLYPYAAEDFLTRPDANFYSQTITQFQVLLNKKLLRMSRSLASHTHIGNKGAPTQPPQAYMPFLPVMPTTIPINTTGAIPNLGGNMVIPGLGLAGDLYMAEPRRSLVILSLLNPQIPPVVAGVTTAGL